MENSQGIAWPRFWSGTEVAAYGSSDMPIWGPLFKSLDPTHDIAVPQRIRNLNDYLVSLQAK